MSSRGRQVDQMNGHWRFLAAACISLALSVAPPAAEGKTLVYGLPANPESLDPAKTNHVFADHVNWHLYDALTVLTKDAREMKPALAESWEVGADGLTYTFHLRKGVRFHDGTPVTAEAVKISYERQYLATSPHYSSDPRNAYESVLKGLIKDIRVVDPMTVVIALTFPRPQQFAIVKIVSPTAAARSGKGFGRQPVGTGPFKFLSWKEDVEVVLARNDDYWGGPPRIERLEFRTIPNSDRMIEALMQGQIHFVPEVDPKYFERIRFSQTTTPHPVIGLNFYYLGFYTDRLPFNDPRLREAVIRAIDAKRAVQILGRGAAIPAINPLPPGSEGYDPELMQPSYDPARARQLLREARVPKDLTLTLVYAAPLSFYAELMHSVQDSLRKVGLNVRLREAKTWRDLVEEAKNGVGEMFFLGFTVSTPDPDRFLYPLFHSKEAAQNNLTRYSNPKVDELLDKARRPMESAQRLKLYQEAQRLIVADMPMLFMFHLVKTAGIDGRVAGLELNLYSFPADKLVGVSLRE